MAEKKPKQQPEVAEAEAAASQKAGKTKKLLVIVLALALLGGGGGAAWWFLVASKQPADAKAEAAKKAAEKPPVYARLDTFTVNLQRTGGDDHYLQVEIQLRIPDEKVNEALKLRMPEIRNAILLLLSSKTKEELEPIEGKQKLSEEIAAQTNQILGAANPEQAGVSGVYFTSFVIQ